nr:Z1 domain-containing protein [Pseudomonas lactis]
MVNQLGFRLNDYREPVLLVVKKNKRILENLAEWLVNYNAGAGGNIDTPLLLIDDEADNASINTNPKKATAINAGIRGLLKVFPRSSYVGFTATPFANVFINPETTNNIEGDDLFPRDFIYTLDAPTNYLGASRIFGEKSDLKCLKAIDDAEEYFPRGQASDGIVEGIPPSLKDAITCFFLVNTIMDIRIGMPKHRSMLVNVSHFTSIQNQVRDIIDHEVRLMQGDIRNYASLPFNEAIRNRSINFLHNAFQRNFSNLDVTWQQVQAHLSASTMPIQTTAVNQKSGPASLDYTAYKEDGLRVVAVGGNSLARGLTLEGLCISYFYRTTQMYDALLQMGRWFGYRVGYEDLCRIWMTEETADWYSHISEATDELRNEVRRMQASRLKPIDFGLRVRSHPESLLITARNKMRDSDEIVQIISITEESLESPRLLKDPSIVSSNYKEAKNFIRSVISCPDSKKIDDSTFPIWQSVPKQLIVKFLKGFINHPLSIKLQTSSLADFIEKSTDNKLKLWDVALPTGSGTSIKLTEEVEVKRRVRKISIDENIKALLVNGTKLRVGSAADEKAGLSTAEIEAAEIGYRSRSKKDIQTVPGKAYAAVRQAPLLLIHLIEPRPEEGKEVSYQLPADSDALVAIGLSFPSLDVSSHRVAYRINLVELRNILSGDSSSIDSNDEEEDDDDE